MVGCDSSFGGRLLSIDLAYAQAYAECEVIAVPIQSPKRQVRIFKNGKSQAIRIPREFELPGNQAMLSKDASGRLILEPLPQLGLMDLLATWSSLEADDQMPEIEERPAEAVTL